MPPTRDSSSCSDRRRRRVRVSTFSLDDEALVQPSTFVDEIPRARLSTEPIDTDASGALEADRWTAGAAVAPSRLDSASREWAALRMAPPRRAMPAAFTARPDRLPSAPGRSVRSRPIWAARSSSSRSTCSSFEEEPDDEEVMDPRRQGQFVHEVFEAFFSAGRTSGHQGDHRRQPSRRRARCFSGWSTSALERLTDDRGGARTDAAARARRPPPGSAKRSSHGSRA